jgi:acetyl-CoA C-acetyltransferase
MHRQRGLRRSFTGSFMETLTISKEVFSMKNQVAIVGVGQTRYEKQKPDQILDEIVFDAASKALEDAGLTREEVDCITIAAGDQIDGRPISSMLEACPAGAYLKDEIKVTEEGSYAAILATMRILSGLFDTSLVVSWSKCSETPVTQITGYSADPFFHRPCGLNYITAEAIQLSKYQKEYGLPAHAAAKVVVKNRKNALKNPLACYRKPVYEEEILNSDVVSWPLRAMDVAPLCDGACAIVLASTKKAKEMTNNPVWIKGMGWATETYYLGERDLIGMTSLEKAAQKAYNLAGIANPLESLDVAEIDDTFSYSELMAYEALGLCERGKSGSLIEEGITEIDGQLPVNPSGGALSGNPFFAAGLVRLAEAALQVRGDAGDHQIDGVQMALAHGSYGFCGQGNSVIILGN